MPATPPGLRHLCRYEAFLDPAVQAFGTTPFGRRTTVLITGGTVEGERLQGKLLPGGGDWALVDTQGILHLDVRATFCTHDDALIHVTYRGLLHPYSRDLRQRIESGELSEEQVYFRTAPRFETSADRYTWLNGILAVAVGHLTASGVAYDVFEVM